MGSDNMVLPKTFTILCEQGLLHIYLIQLLESKGWKYIPFVELYLQKPKMYVDFAWFGASIGKDYLRYDPRIYEVNTYLKNLLVGSGVRGEKINKDIITNKHSLYFQFYTQFPEVCNKHLCYSSDINRVNTINNDDVLILRPVGSGAGGGANVYIVKTINELNYYKRKLNRFPFVLASNYIKNPMLINLTKFHLRMLWVVYPDKNGNYHHMLYPYGKIVTAKNKFKNSDYSNPDIHDTHFKSTCINRYFPEDLKCINNLTDEIIESLYAQMNLILESTFSIYKSNINSFPETKYGFEVFGCDFMITDDNVIKLLEINARHDYGVDDLKKLNPDGFKGFCESFYKWIFEIVILPIFE